jgi:hypothetical protein
MNRFAASLICLGLSVSPTLTQTPAELLATATFSVHEDKIGESLADWKARTKYPYVVSCIDQKDGTVACTRTTAHDSSVRIPGDSSR